MEPVIAIVIVGIVVLAIFDRLLGRRKRTPHPGEVWFASVPFTDDRSQSKDRPVLIVRVADSTLTIRKITSQDQSQRPDQYEPLPPGAGGLNKQSWVKKQPEPLSASRLRRRVGVAGGVSSSVR